ncbi:MAG: hypothetical protein ACI9R3_005470, partial [Verrucomicrobiales bacterium]
VAPLEIKSLTLDSGNPQEITMATLTWGSSSDRLYAVESSTDLDVWLEIDDGIESEGAEITWTGTVQQGTIVFYYRIVEIE